MKLNRDENLLELKNRTLDLNQVLQDLADKDSNEMGEHLVSNFSLPREIRMGALRMVLNDYVKMAKDLKLTDEFMYRLNWYQEFTEYQLVLFWHCLVNDNSEVFDEAKEVQRFKKNFYLLILMNVDTLEIDDELIEKMLHLTTNPLNDFDDFLKATDACFYDYDYHFDGLAFEYIKNVLRKSATVVDIRNIAAKYQINVPKRLKKDEFVALVAEGLRRQGKFDETTIDKLKKMSAISLQRFAKVNNIKASTEMKKDDVIEYVMNNIDKAPLVKRAPRVELNLPEALVEFVFSKEYLREVMASDEEDDNEAPQDVKEQETYIETVVAPVVPEPVVEEKANVIEAPAETEIVKEEVKEEVHETKEDTSEQDLIEKIIKVLEAREEKEEKAPVKDNSEELNNIIKLYEDRINSLEKLIDDLRTNPIPVNVTVAYPDYPLQPIVIEQGSGSKVEEEKETEIVNEAPVIETLPQKPEVEEEIPSLEDEALEPIVYDTAFDSLTSDEKALLSKDLMSEKEAVSFVNEEPKKKLSKKERKALARQEKVEQIKQKNDLETYRRRKRLKVWHFFTGLFWVIVLTALALFIWMLLYDFGVAKDFVSESMNDMFSKIPGLDRDGAFRGPVSNWCIKALDVVKGWFTK